MTTSTTKVRPPSWIWRLLALQLGDGPVDLGGGAGPNPVAGVENPVDGRLAQAGLEGDLPDPERVAHERLLLMAF